MSYAQFQIAFWHPFGPHGRETPEAIIKRKRTEIATNGWTLWSFQHRPMLNDWYRELLSAAPNAVFVFCSEGRGAIDPARAGTLNVPIDCQSYRFIGEHDENCSPMPQGVRVPHPFSPTKKLASAFVVQRVIYPVELFHRPNIEWFSPTKGPWCDATLPTRGEYLIRPGGTVAMRSVRAVLELRPPYLATVSADRK